MCSYTEIHTLLDIYLFGGCFPDLLPMHMEDCAALCLLFSLIDLFVNM